MVWPFNPFGILMDKFPALDKLLHGRSLKLPSLPAVGLKILDVVKSEDFSIKELARTISADQALAAKTLQVSNSALYSPLTRVDSIERAVATLGVNTLKNIALSFVILGKLKEFEKGDFDYNFFWKRAVTSAVAAETLAPHVKGKVADAFVTSMLMDLGIIIMYLTKPDEYERVLAQKNATGLDSVKMEHTIFGFDHAEVSKEMLAKWGIPESIYVPIAFHHNDRECPKAYREHVLLIQVSDLVSSIYHGGKGVDPALINNLRGLLSRKFSFSKSDINKFLDDVAEKTIAVLATFNIPAGSMRPYSDILQEANEELAKLNADYGELVIKLQEANEHSKKLTLKLRDANKRLKTMAFKDSLTGLYNHRFFHEMIDKEISRIERHSLCFSLILFDVDNFKQINDTLGHNMGDEVLKGVSRILQKSIRESDFGARMGGDEYAALLPETDLKDAAKLAERLRHSVNVFSRNFSSKEGLGFSISVGVGEYRPADGKKKKEEILEEVDKAIYRSKEKGKNTVTIVQ